MGKISEIVETFDTVEISKIVDISLIFDKSR